ncbi:MAG: hypothetical protein V6Z89_14090 [Desulfobacter sp.]
MERENPDTFDVKGRIVRLKLVDGTLINGQANIARDPGYDRLSDLVSSANDSFLVLFGVTLYDAGSGIPVKYETLFVNKTHILWVEPEESQK